jgi:hypothetical protein
MTDPTPTARFRRWFADSIAVDANGAPLILYHGTRAIFDRFAVQNRRNPGFHFGSLEQALMRCGSGSALGRSASRGRIIPVYLSIRRAVRLVDRGGITAEQIRSAKSRGYDGIVYLNRYEGIPTERIQALAETGDLADLDRVSDRRFRRLVPEARDSWIVFEPTQIKSVFNPGSWDPSDARPHDGPGPIPALDPCAAGDAWRGIIDMIAREERADSPEAMLAA